MHARKIIILGLLLSSGVACLVVQHTLSEDRASRLIHLPGAFAKTKKATNILRPAIDVSFLGAAEEFLGAA